MGNVAAYLLVAVGVFSNLGGISLSGKINSIVAILLFMIGSALVISTTPAAIPNYHLIVPKFDRGPILSSFSCRILGLCWF